ncbi:MAG TPA: hypothetical protein VIL78_07820 [Hanamia sp.]
MKFIFLLIFLLGVHGIKAQKYVLLDKHMAQPVIYSNTVTVTDNFNGLFPVEKKNLKQFINALEEIVKKLSAPGPLRQIKQYEIGCIKFRGLTVSQSNEERLDYVLTSTCDNIKISMHLSDSKTSNANNAFFIKTWIKYIKSSIK